MQRRDFLAASVVAAGALGGPAASGKDKQARPQYYELRRYQLLPGDKRRAVEGFYQDAAIEALNRLGVGPVGVFRGKYGPAQSTLFVLLPHESLDSVVTLSARMLADAKLREAGASFLDASPTEPVYESFDSSLMVAFSHSPRLLVPPQTAENQARIFELRTYQSHSIKAGVKKVEMFNEGGEIEIFHKTGLRPVFFGKTLIGPQCPNLTYMLAFSDMAERDKAWETFLGDPAWKKLKTKEEYHGTVSNITDFILQPARCSQI